MVRSDEDTAQLLERRDSGHDLGQAVVPERAHALLERLLLDLFSAGAPDCHPLEVLGHDEELVDADPALVARLAAAWAAALAIEGHSVGGGCDVRRNAIPQELVGRGVVHLA